MAWAKLSEFTPGQLKRPAEKPLQLLYELDLHWLSLGNNFNSDQGQSFGNNEAVQVLKAFRSAQGQISEPQAIATILCGFKPGFWSVDVSLTFDL